jgi:hypothetical protein
MAEVQPEYIGAGFEQSFDFRGAIGRGAQRGNYFCTTISFHD